MKLSCIEKCNSITNSYSKNQSYFEFKDNARSEMGRLSLNTDNNSQYSCTLCNVAHCNHTRRGSYRPMRKPTEASFPELEERITVSATCLEKMKGEVDLLVPKRRK
jgi:hypothetical protein